MFHDSPERAKVVPARLDHHNEEPAAQPSEPTLFPKLRIYIADFPFLADSQWATGCQPWMPDAVMGTARAAGIYLLLLFKASEEHNQRVRTTS